MKYLELFKRDKSRSLQLDFLRGIAILLVLCRHNVFETSGQWLAKPLALGFVRFGWAGVDLFFVLSGFLVGGLLFRELKSRSQIDTRRFVLRRGFKIWPAFYVYLVALIFIQHYTGPVVSLKKDIISLIPSFLHYQNYAPPVRGHTWSLAVEEHFYIFLPLFLYFVTLKNKGQNSYKAIPWMAVFLIVFCTGMRYYATTTGRLDFGRLLKPTHLRMDSLFFGVLLAYIYIFKPEYLSFFKKHRLLTLLAGIALLSPMMILILEKSPFVFSIGFTMLYLGFGLILLSFVYSPVDSGVSGWFFKSRFSRLVAFIGFHSYSIYLWHFDLGTLPFLKIAPLISIQWLPKSLVWVYVTALYWTAAVTGGVIAGVLVERPFLMLRERLFPSRNKALE